MRILILTDLPEMGGSSTICLTLVQKFVAWGHRVTVLTRWHKGYHVSEGVLAECQRMGVKVLWSNHPGGCYGGRPVAALWEVAQHVRPEIIVANGTGWLAPILGLLMPSSQVLYYYINHDEQARPFRRLRWFSLWVDRFAVITPMSLEPLIARNYMRRPVWWLPQFSEPANCFVEQAGSCRAFSCVSPKVGFIGSLSEAKGVPHLLELWRSLQLPGELKFVGKGPCLDKVRQAEAATVGRAKGRVVYAGAFDARDRDEYLRAFFSQLDFLMMPSMMPGEGTPTVILEALAFGVPVLATDMGGTACFKLGWMAAPQPYMVEAVSLPELGDALLRYSHASPFSHEHRRAIQDYFRQWFGDEIIGARWRSFVGKVFPVL